MAKGSGGTRGGVSGNSRNKSSKSWEELMDGWKNYMELYSDTEKYSAADVRAFEAVIENSTYKGELYRATIFTTKADLDSFIDRITNKGELTSISDFSAPPSKAELEIGGYSKRARSVVSFSRELRQDYLYSDWLDDEGVPYYPVVFRKTGNGSVVGKDVVSEGEVAVSVKKNKFRVNRVYKEKDDWLETGYYTVVEIS